MWQVLPSQTSRDTLPKGAQHGYSDTTDDPAIPHVPLRHGQSVHGDGLVWPGAVGCGGRAGRWRWHRDPPERDASPWGAHHWLGPQWGTPLWAAYQWPRPQCRAHHWPGPQWGASLWAAHPWPPSPRRYQRWRRCPSTSTPRSAPGACPFHRHTPAGIGEALGLLAALLAGVS